MGEFGDKFRKAREKKELSLDDVSNVTKIGARMLRAIEEEHFDQLPGGIFNRGFIRAYAKQLDLDPEEAVNEYLACLRQAQLDSQAALEAQYREARAAAASQTEPTPSSKSTASIQTPVEVPELPELQLPRIEDVRPPKKYLDRISAGVPWLWIAAALCLMISLYFMWTRYSRGTRSIAAASNSSPVLQPTTAAPTPVPQAAPTSVAPASQHPATPVPKAATPTPPATKSEQEPATTPATTNHAPDPVQETTADPDAVKVENKEDVTIRSFGTSVAQPAEKPVATLTLVVRASENSWISVISDGQLVTQETLIAPAATSFHASRELIVRVGNAAGVSFLWNGEELPPQGSEAEAKTFIFDAVGMRSASLPPPP